MITKNGWDISKEKIADSVSHFLICSVIMGLYYAPYLPTKVQKEYNELTKEELNYIKKRLTK